jgi:hypothetical protein
LEQPICLGPWIQPSEEGSSHFPLLTNFPRFEKRIYIPLPGKVARRYLIDLKAKKAEATLNNEELDKLAA